MVGLGGGWVAPLKGWIRPAALCVNQERPNEVQIIRLGGREDCHVRDLPLESRSGKTESLRELDSEGRGSRTDLLAVAEVLFIAFLCPAGPET